MKLTQQQIDDFNSDGWLFLPELFSREEVELLAREAVNIYDTNRPEVWREKSGAPRTAFAAHLYNEAFGLLGAHPRMIDPVEQIFGEKETNCAKRNKAQPSQNCRFPDFACAPSGLPLPEWITEDSS